MVSHKLPKDNSPTVCFLLLLIVAILMKTILGRDVEGDEGGSNTIMFTNEYACSLKWVGSCNNEEVDFIREI